MIVLSPADLDRRSEAAARALRAAGVGAGDRVALVGAPSVDAVAALVGLWRMGAVAVPLSTRLPDAAVAPLLAQVGAAFFLTDRPAPVPPGVRMLGLPLSTDTRGPAVPPFRTLASSSPALVVFTSGSTGAPKAALLTLGNLTASASGVNAALAFGPGDGWLLALPLFHVGGVGVLVRALLTGANLVLPGPGVPAEVALADPSVTHASLVSTQLFRLLRGEVESLPALRAVLLGGSAFPAGLLERAHARGLPVATSYGLTEMASTVTVTAPGAPLADLRTSGRVLPHRELRIHDGELLVRGETRFLGYLGEPAPAQAGGGIDAPFPFGNLRFDADGWFATGDLGRLDAEGRLIVTGRRDSRFVSGGENVQPEEIEAALLALPGVARAVVVPVADAEFGYRPVAFVATDGGDPPDADVLLGMLAERLPRFKLPVRLLPWPSDVPDGGKPDRKALAGRAGRS